MKKSAKMMLMGLGLAAVLGGCGAKAEDAATASKATQGESVAEVESSAAQETTKDPVTLTYWQHSSAARDEMMTELVKDFEAQNPDIKIKLEFIPEGDYSQKLVPSLATDTAPDVFQIQSGMVAKLAAAGAIQPLDENVMPADMIEKEFVPATVNGLKYNDQYYGMPTDVQTIILFWNKALVAEAGLDAENGPQTWEEFFDWARKLTKRDGDALVQSGWGGKGYVPELLSFIEQKGRKVL